MARDDAARSAQVGIFLAIGIAALVVVVLLLGKSQALFARKAALHCSFDNISGLVVGAPVRLAGVDIGIVQSIRFEKDLRERQVHVQLGIDSRYLPRIRQDSVAHLDSKGLLGDMIINLSVGSAEQPPLKDGDLIRSQESAGLTKVIDSVQEGIGEIRGLTGTLQQRLNAVLTDQLAHDVGRIAHSTANVVEKVETGSGLVHALVYEPRMTRAASDLIDDARGVIQGVDTAVGRVDKLLAAVESGDGTLHALLYSPDGKQLLAEARQAMHEIGGVVGEIQHGKGLLHSLVYEEDRTNLIQNLTAMSRTLRDIVEEVDRGKGSLGALLKDPSVYEDLKTILGNLKRNKLLKALVRYTISRDSLSAGSTTKVE